MNYQQFIEEVERRVKEKSREMRRLPSISTQQLRIMEKNEKGLLCQRKESIFRLPFI